METRKLSMGEKQVILILRKKHCTNIGQSQYSNWECHENDRNDWCTEQHRQNGLAKEINNS